MMKADIGFVVRSRKSGVRAVNLVISKQLEKRPDEQVATLLDI
jgi:hypothetical protein